MRSSQIKEDISISYISLLCAYAGIVYETIRHDEDSTDGLLRKCILTDEGKRFNSHLRIQLKCTSSVSQYVDKGETIIYRLKVKNYNDLCMPSTTPIILGLLVLPEEESEWIQWSPEELMIKGCMYWARFSGEMESSNLGMVNIAINKQNIVNAYTLEIMMKMIAEEDWV